MALVRMVKPPWVNLLDHNLSAVRLSKLSSEYYMSSTNQVFAVYGAAGCGRSLMPIAAEQLKRIGNDSKTVFIDDSLDDDGI